MGELRSWSTTIFGIPVAQPRPKVAVRGGKPHGYYKDNGIKLWRQRIADAAHQAIGKKEMTLIKKPKTVALSCVFLFPRPRTRPAKHGMNHYTKPDLDNLVKAVKDAISGIIIEDDSQIDTYIEPFFKEHTNKQPYVKITIQEQPTIGIVKQKITIFEKKIK